jgi:iron complex transport system permease protein
VTAEVATGDVRAAKVPGIWILASVVAVVAAGLAGLTIGAVSLSPGRVFLEVLDHVPGVHVHSGLSPRDAVIVWQLRLPRVVLGLLVGAMLAVAGAAYQGVFRNPLADTYLLGASSGAGLGATLAIVGRLTARFGPFDPVPLAAFVGALAAVAVAYALAQAAGRGNPAVLLLAGIAVSYFLQAIQTYLLQRHADTIREVYSFLLGRLSNNGWHEVLAILPYTVVTSGVLIVCGRSLDVLSVGDDEAASLGLHVNRIRIIVVIAATMASAAAVSVSGLIAFVGIVVPHTIRLIAGNSYRVILPLSLLLGAAFLVAADLVARTSAAPAEIPIGVVTALFGAPFFAMVLWFRRRPAL